MIIDLPAIEIVRITPSNLGRSAAVKNQLTVKPVESGVWDEFLQLQISPATRNRLSSILNFYYK